MLRFVGMASKPYGGLSTRKREILLTCLVTSVKFSNPKTKPNSVIVEVRETTCVESTPLLLVLLRSSVSISRSTAVQSPQLKISILTLIGTKLGGKTGFDSSRSSVMRAITMRL